MTDGTGIFYLDIVCTLHLTINDVNVVSNNEIMKTIVSEMLYCYANRLTLLKR